MRLACDPGVVLYGGEVFDTNEQGLEKVSWAEGSQWSIVWESGSGYLLEWLLSSLKAVCDERGFVTGALLSKSTIV